MNKIYCYEIMIFKIIKKSKCVYIVIRFYRCLEIYQEKDLFVKLGNIWLLKPLLEAISQIQKVFLKFIRYSECHLYE